MFNLRNYLLLLSLFFVAAHDSSATTRLDKIKLIRVYHIKWAIVTRIAVDGVDLRRSSQFTSDVSKPDEIEALSSFLKGLEWKSSQENFASKDLRALIDIQYVSGKVETYTADRIDIFDLERKRTVPLTSEFKERLNLRE